MRWARESAYDSLLGQVTGGDLEAVIRLKAIIAIESSFNPLATHQDTDGKSSYGLTQFRESTARALGFAGDMEDLFDPAVILPLSVKLLRQLEAEVGTDFPEVLSAWNCGSTGRQSRCRRRDGTYTNAGHVARGMDAYRYFRSLYVGPRVGPPPPPAGPEPEPPAPRPGVVPDPGLVAVIAVLLVLVALLVLTF